MNFKISKFLLFLIITSLLIGALPSIAEENTVEDAKSILNGIIEYECSKADAESVQALINGALTEKAGDSSEWYAIALCRHGSYDFSKYGRALDKYLQENEVNSASTRLKMMLALIATGVESDYIEKTLDDSIGKQGIMSLVFGLHVLNNGATSKMHTKDSLIDEILALQLSDGSWAVNGKNGDIDTTAMTIQALAQFYESENIKKAIDNALTFLSEKQKENGGFVMYGVNNPESASQVIIALSALGIDCNTDKRFIKNGNGIFDAISLFRLDDGSFSHTEGGKSNRNATVQVLSAMVAYIRMTEGKSPFYVLNTQENGNGDIEESIISEPAKSDEIPLPKEPKAAKIGYKTWAVLAIIAIAVTACVILIIRKNKSKRNFILIAIITAIALIFVVTTDFKSADDYYSNADISKENVIGKVTISIRCDTVVGKSEASHIPQNGVLLDRTEFEIRDGDTVYDILIEATAKNKIHLETNGSPETAYVEGIGNIYEFDFGDLSGWMYFVNGNEQNVGCGECILKPDDVIEWVYSCNMGDDLK